MKAKIVVFGLSWNEFLLHERIQKLENKVLIKGSE